MKYPVYFFEGFPKLVNSKRNYLLIDQVFRFLPLAEVIMLSGFFFISGLEETIHHFLHPHKVATDSVSTESTSSSYGTNENDLLLQNDEHEQKTKASGLKQAIRTACTVSALSFHSIIEGKREGFKKKMIFITL